MTATLDAPTDDAAADTASALRRMLEQDLEGGASSVRFDDYTRHLFSRDASMYTIMPMGVAFPRHADDVAAAVRACHELGVPVVPRGAGTSLAGQTVGPGLVLDLSRYMAEIVSIDPETRTARVQMGVVQDDLNRAAAPYGLMFGPDTSTSNRATIGGMIGNNSAGSGSVRYGMTIDHVRSLDVVLADGSRATLEPVDEDERRRRAGADTLEGAIYRRLPEIVEANRPAIESGFPRTGAGPAATASTGWSTGRRSTWPSSWWAPRARWWSAPRPSSTSCPSRSTPSSASVTSTACRGRSTPPRTR